MADLGGRRGGVLLDCHSCDRLRLVDLSRVGFDRSVHTVGTAALIPVSSVVVHLVRSILNVQFGHECGLIRVIVLGQKLVVIGNTYRSWLPVDRSQQGQRRASVRLDSWQLHYGRGRV